MISSPEIQEPSVSGFCMRQNYFAALQKAWTIAIIIGKNATILTMTDSIPIQPAILY